MSTYDVALWLDRWESMSMLAPLEAMLRNCSVASERGASGVIQNRTGLTFKLWRWTSSKFGEQIYLAVKGGLVVDLNKIMEVLQICC